MKINKIIIFMTLVSITSIIIYINLNPSVKLNNENPQDSFGDEEIIHSSKDISSKVRSKQKKYYEFGLKSGMLPISLYGKVIDQDGVTIVNAKIPFCTGGSYLAPGKGCGATHTDENGQFLIKSEGGSLTLYQFTHPGIDFQFPKPNYIGLHSVRILEMSFYGFQRHVDGNDPLWTDTTKNKPYIFTAWRQGEFENVKTGSVYGYLKSDSSIFTYNFSRKRKYRTLEGKKSGHLWVSCTRGSMIKHDEKGDWKVIITPINGGIQATDDR